MNLINKPLSKSQIEKRRKRNYGTVMTQKQIKEHANRQGRNEPCACGSGKKYKHCCGK